MSLYNNKVEELWDVVMKLMDVDTESPAAMLVEEVGFVVVFFIRL